MVFEYLVLHRRSRPIRNHEKRAGGWVLQWDGRHGTAPGTSGNRGDWSCICHYVIIEDAAGESRRIGYVIGASALLRKTTVARQRVTTRGGMRELACTQCGQVSHDGWVPAQWLSLMRAKCICMGKRKINVDYAAVDASDAPQTARLAALRGLKECT